MRLISCSSCQLHIRADEPACPHCGATVRTTFAPGSMLVLLGLALTACPSDDDASDTAVEGTMSTTTAATTESGTSSTSLDSSSTMSEVTTIGEDSAYGTPDTGITQTDTSSEGSSDTGSSSSDDSSSDSSSGTGTDATTDGTGGTGAEPLYGAMDSG